MKTHRKLVIGLCSRNLSGISKQPHWCRHGAQECVKASSNNRHYMNRLQLNIINSVWSHMPSPHLSSSTSGVDLSASTIRCSLRWKPPHCEKQTDFSAFQCRRERGSKPLHITHGVLTKGVLVPISVCTGRAPLRRLCRYVVWKVFASCHFKFKGRGWWRRKLCGSSIAQHQLSQVRCTFSAWSCRQP